MGQYLLAGFTLNSIPKRSDGVLTMKPTGDHQESFLGVDDFRSEVGVCFL